MDVTLIRRPHHTVSGVSTQPKTGRLRAPAWKAKPIDGKWLTVRRGTFADGNDAACQRGLQAQIPRARDNSIVSASGVQEERASAFCRDIVKDLIGDFRMQVNQDDVQVYGDVGDAGVGADSLDLGFVRMNGVNVVSSCGISTYGLVAELIAIPGGADNRYRHGLAG